MKGKKVLIISYYWPPSGGSGVQRWLFFVKYLREFGWEPLVFTVENGEYPYLDKSLEKQIPKGIQVIKCPIWEPYDVYRKIRGKSRHEKITPTAFVEKGGLLKKMSIWIRGNIFIPDPRILWLMPAARKILQTFAKDRFDVVVSTGPPHSMHLIGRVVAKRLKLPWLADFRDPWTQSYTASQMSMGAIARRIHSLLEQKVLKSADCVVTVSNSCKTGLQALVDRPIEVITNGYEPFDVVDGRSANRFILLYAGALSFDRNPGVFWNALNRYLGANDAWKRRFVLRLIGTIDNQIIQYLRANCEHIHVEAEGPMAHDKLVTELCEASALLLVGVRNDPGVLTGKLFEYLYLKRPIVSIAPSNGDIEQILRRCGAGWNADFGDEKSCHSLVENLFGNAGTGLAFDEEAISAFSRKHLTGRLAALMDGLCHEFRAANTG